MERSVFDAWSDRVLLRALEDAGWPVAGMLYRFMSHALTDALQDPKNWGKPIRFRHDARTRRQAARVTRALRRAKPGELVRL